MITDTSLLAFEKIKPSLGERQFQVFKAFKKLEYATNTMVSNYLNLPINCITGRCKELRDKNLLKRSHISTCPITKNRAQYWTLTKFEGGKKWKKQITGQRSVVNILKQ